MPLRQHTKTICPGSLKGMPGGACLRGWMEQWRAHPRNPGCKNFITGCSSSAQVPISEEAVHLQELKSKLESWRGDGWLEQCCTSLAEQLRVAQAENAELQQELEVLR